MERMWGDFRFSQLPQSSGIQFSEDNVLEGWWNPTSSNSKLKGKLRATNTKADGWRKSSMRLDIQRHFLLLFMGIWGQCWPFLLLPYLLTSHPIRSTSKLSNRLFLNIVWPVKLVAGDFSGNTVSYLLAHILSFRTISCPRFSINLCSLVYYSECRYIAC